MYIIIVASLNENVKLANKIQDKLNKENIKNEMINLIELDLPMYSSKIEDEGIPKIVQNLHSKFENAKAFIIVSPEYNYSIAPSLTNAIAWVSRVGDDFRKIFTNKNTLLTTHSGGGGTDMLKGLRLQLSKLNAKVYDKEVITTYKKRLDEKYLDEVLNEFIKL